MRKAIGGFLAVVMLAGCQAAGAPSTSPATATSQSPAAPAASQSPATSGGESRVLKLYNVDALTGKQASFGTRQMGGAGLHVKEINDAGGFTDDCGNNYTIEMSKHDTGDSAEAAVALVREAAADPSVLAVVGPTASVFYVPVVPVAGQLQIPVMSTGSGATIAAWNPYAYRINLTPATATPIMMQKLKEFFDIKRIGIIYDISNDGQASDAKTIQDLGSKLGYEVVAFESFRSGDVDMRPQLTTIKAANPDWIAYNASGGEILGTVFNQAVSLGMDEINRITGFDQWAVPPTWDLTEGRVKGGYSWAAARNPASDVPEIKKFVQDFKAFANDDPIKESLYGYDVVGVYADAVKRSCTATDRQKFNEALRSTSGYQGLSGKVAFGTETGDNQSADVVVVQTEERGLSKVVEGP